MAYLFGYACLDVTVVAFFAFEYLHMSVAHFSLSTPLQPTNVLMTACEQVFVARFFSNFCPTTAHQHFKGKIKHAKTHNKH